jgi:putative ABC transport system permease protein
VLTLITLSLGGAIFIGTFNARASLDSYVRKLGNYFMADVNLTLSDSYRIEQVREALKDVPGVGQVEGWAYGRSELLLADDKAGDAVQILAPPGDSALIQPIMLKGRWVTKNDRKAIVLSERFLSQYPDLEVGDTLRLRVNGEKMDWKVVGFFQLAGKSAGFVAYSNYEYLSVAVHAPNRAAAFRIVGDVPGMTLAQQEALGSRIEAAMQERGYAVTDVSAGQSLIENTSRPLNVLTLFLLLMAILTALVGSIGLMGTMSMNVIDRTREIGVMRAIGASDRAVMNMVLVEGMLIGLISWVLAALAAIPISKVLSDTIHLAVFDARSEFTFTAFGPLAWLGVVILLSVLASVLPARNAAHLTIREALAYE